MKLNVKVFKDKDTKEWVKEDEITKERLALTEEDKVVVGMLDDLEQLPYLFEIPDLAVILCRKGYRKQSEFTPCDCCKFNPPTSGDGKPCFMCPAQAKGGEDND